MTTAKISRAAICGSDDIAASLALLCSGLCFIATAFSYQYSLLFAGIVAALYVIPCCRRHMPSGVLGGSSALLLGTWLGLLFVQFWNDEIPGIRNIPINSPLRVMIKEAFPIIVLQSPQVLYASLATGLTALLLEFVRRKTRARYQSLCVVLGYLIFVKAAYITMAIHVANAVFLVMPLDTKYISVGNKVFRAPPIFAWNNDLLLGLAAAGAIVTWLTLLYRPALNDGSWFRSSLLVLIIMANLGVIALCFVDLPSLSRYVSFVGDSITWQLVAINTSGLMVTAFLHSGVQLPHPKKKPAPPPPTSVRVHKFHQPPPILYQQHPYIPAAPPLWTPSPAPYGYINEPAW